MDYEYDVFISYEREPRREYWVTNYFEPLLLAELSDCLGRRAKVFVDKTEIQGGADWEKSLGRALAKSRCLVPVFSGTYFTSEWCCREFAIVHHRQKQCGFLTTDCPSGLIVPVVVRDGKHLPAEAKRLHQIELHAYYTDSRAFRKCLGYRRFEKKIQQLAAGDVLEAINRAPKQCDPRWLESELSDIDIGEIFMGQTIETTPVTITTPPRLI